MLRANAAAFHKRAQPLPVQAGEGLRSGGGTLLYGSSAGWAGARAAVCKHQAGGAERALGGIFGKDQKTDDGDQIDAGDGA